jgi:hypothetical protein
VRAQYGEITAVLHGAGVIEDRLLLDKTAESFDRVVGTKLQPMLHLLKLLDRERLRHLVLFSSTAAFWGNPGQVDYAAANEILNRIGRHLSDVWPGKTTAIGWGPWSGGGGMVTPEVAREFAKHGIPLVPVAEGRVAAWRELVSPGREARVLIGRGPWSDSAASDANGASRESLFYSTFSGAKDRIPAPARATPLPERFLGQSLNNRSQNRGRFGRERPVGKISAAPDPICCRFDVRLRPRIFCGIRRETRLVADLSSTPLTSCSLRS